MALYGQYSMLFKSEDFSDFTLKCNGTSLPVHRIVLATHSTVLRRAMRSGFKETRERVMNFSKEDPAILEKFISIMYRGNYDDICHGDVQGPHIVTTLPLHKVHLVAEGKSGHDRDKIDFNALCKFTQKHDPEEFQTMEYVFEALQNALYIYLMGRKYQCDIATAIAHDRFHHTAKLYFGKKTFRNIELERIVEFIDELYTNTTADAPIRSTLCCQISNFSRRLPHIQIRLRQYAVGVLNAHPDFGRDINKLM